MNLSLGGDETNLYYIMLPRHHKWDIHISSSRRRNIGFYYRFLIVACLLGVKSTHWRVFVDVDRHSWWHREWLFFNLIQFYGHHFGNLDKNFRAKEVYSFEMCCEYILANRFIRFIKNWIGWNILQCRRTPLNYRAEEYLGHYEFKLSVILPRFPIYDFKTQTCIEGRGIWTAFHLGSCECINMGKYLRMRIIPRKFRYFRSTRVGRKCYVNIIGGW